MNPLTQIKNTQKISAQEVREVLFDSSSVEKAIPFSKTLASVPCATECPHQINLRENASLISQSLIFLQIISGVKDSASWHARFKHSACVVLLKVRSSIYHCVALNLFLLRCAGTSLQAVSHTI